MFALALISVSVSGSTGARLLHTLEQEITHGRRRLVGEWTLERGLLSRNVHCGPLCSYLLNEHAKALLLLPLGCAIKTQKSSGEKLSKPEIRWFMFDLRDEQPMIHYFAPTTKMPAQKNLGEKQKKSIELDLKDYDSKDPLTMGTRGTTTNIFKQRYHTLQLDIVDEAEKLTIIFGSEDDQLLFQRTLAACLDTRKLNMDHVMIQKTRESMAQEEKVLDGPVKPTPADSPAASPTAASDSGPETEVRGMTVFDAILNTFENGPTKAALDKLHAMPVFQEMENAQTCKGVAAGNDFAQDKRYRSGTTSASNFTKPTNTHKSNFGQGPGPSEI